MTISEDRFLDDYYAEEVVHADGGEHSVFVPEATKQEVKLPVQENVPQIQYPVADDLPSDAESLEEEQDQEQVLPLHEEAPAEQIVPFVVPDMQVEAPHVQIVPIAPPVNLNSPLPVIVFDFAPPVENDFPLHEFDLEQELEQDEEDNLLANATFPFQFLLKVLLVLIVVSLLVLVVLSVVIIGPVLVSMCLTAVYYIVPVVAFLAAVYYLASSPRQRLWAKTQKRERVERLRIHYENNKNLIDQTDCPVCMDVSHRSTILFPCLHQICAQCHNEHFFYIASQCPSCRTMIEESVEVEGKPFVAPFCVAEGKTKNWVINWCSGDHVAAGN